MNIEDGEVHLLRNKNYPHNSTGLSLDPEYLVTGFNSGFQALNLAILAGVKTIIFIGLDGNTPKQGEKTHWFGDHPRREPDAVYGMIRNAFKVAKREVEKTGVRVINCSPGTAITDFEMMPLEQAIESL